MEDNLDAPLWTTCPWVIRLGLFQGNYSSLFWQVFSWQKSHGCFLLSICHHLRKILSNSYDGFMGKVQAINEVLAADRRIKYLPKPVGRERIYFLDGCVHTCRYRNRALVTEGFPKQIL